MSREFPDGLFDDASHNFLGVDGGRGFRVRSFRVEELGRSNKMEGILVLFRV